MSKKVLTKANLPVSTRLYDLRHSCASLLLQAGVHIPRSLPKDSDTERDADNGRIQSRPTGNAGRGNRSTRTYAVLLEFTSFNYH
jgi:hypothetical protein